MWAKYAHGIPPGIPDFIFCSFFVFIKWPFLSYNLQILHGNRSKLYLQDDDEDDDYDDDDNDDEYDEDETKLTRPIFKLQPPDFVW